MQLNSSPKKFGDHLDHKSLHHLKMDEKTIMLETPYAIIKNTNTFILYTCWANLIWVQWVTFTYNFRNRKFLYLYYFVILLWW